MIYYKNDIVRTTVISMIFFMISIMSDDMFLKVLFFLVGKSITSLMAVILCVYKMKPKHWILYSMLFGSAVSFIIFFGDCDVED